jgi:hypothetical protein
MPDNTRHHRRRHHRRLARADLRVELAGLRRFVDSLWGEVERLRAQTDARFDQAFSEIDALAGPAAEQVRAVGEATEGGAP